MNTFERLRGAAIAAPVALALSLALTGCPSPTGIGGAQDIPADALKLEAVKTFAVGAHPHGIVPAGGLLVNANTGSGTISLIDPAADAVVKTLKFGGADHSSPNNTMAAPGGRYAVALDTVAHVLRIIDGESREQVQEVSLPARPGVLAWADEKTAYVTLLPASSGGGHHAMSHDAHAPGKNVLRVTWPDGFEAKAETHALAVNRKGMSSFTAGTLAVGGGYLAVANTPDHSVSFAPLADLHAVKTVKDGNGPAALAISTYGGNVILIIVNATSNSVTLYDLKAEAILKTLQVGSTPSDMVLRGDGRYAYVTCKGAGEVAVIDLASQSLSAQLKVGRNLADTPSQPMHAFAVAKPGASDGNAAQQIWIGCDGDDSMTVIDGEAQKVVAVVKVGKGMHKAAFTAEKAYVSNMKDGTISVVDRSVIK